jgi:hypothetical protein
MKITLEPAVENIIMYMPVADETGGGTPMLRSSGLNIAPPPRPNAPETHPPIRAKTRSFVKVCLVNLRSLGKSFPAFSLILYVSRSFLTEILHIVPHITKNIA